MENELDFRDYIVVIYKRRSFLIGFILCSIMAAIIANFLIKPSYQATTTISLGRYNNTVYTNTTSAREVFLSNDTLMEVMEQLKIDINTQNIEELRKNIIVDEIKNTSLLSIKVTSANPNEAKHLTDILSASFLKKAVKIYNDNLFNLQEGLKKNQELEEITKKSIERNKKLLYDYSQNVSGNDYQRNTLFEFVRNDEAQLLALQSRSLQINIDILTLEKPQVINKALVPEQPFKPQKKFNIFVALIAGVIIGHVIIFTNEYLSRYPLLQDAKKGQ